MMYYDVGSYVSFIYMIYIKSITYFDIIFIFSLWEDWYIYRDRSAMFVLNSIQRIVICDIYEI